MYHAIFALLWLALRLSRLPGSFFIQQKPDERTVFPAGRSKRQTVKIM